MGGISKAVLINLRSRAGVVLCVVVVVAGRVFWVHRLVERKRKRCGSGAASQRRRNRLHNGEVWKDGRTPFNIDGAGQV